MLHFLATLALCIFIGERLWHYYGEAKRRRQHRRAMEMLYPDMSQYK